MSKLPIGWMNVNLFDICQPSQWKTISIKELLPRGYIVYGANGAIGFYKEYTHEKPTLMITCRGATCGNIHISQPFSYINGNAMALDHLLEDVCNINYLAYFLRYRGLDDAITGSAQPQITQGNLQVVLIDLAPPTEQTRIVGKLEELFSDLDAGVAELKAAQKKLAQYRQSLLKSAVTGELTAEWRKKKGPLSPTPLPQRGEGLSLALKTPLAPCGRGAGGEGETGAQLLARILKERRTRWEEKQLAKFKEQGKTPPKGWQDKYPEPVQPDTTNLPELPEGWVWASLDQLSEIQGGIQKQPSRKPMVNNYPFLRVANVLRGRLKLDNVHEIELFSGELERLRLQKGDILIVEGNGSINEIGRCALWNGSIENTVHQNHLIRSRPIVISSEFVEAWLNSLHGIDLITKLAATTSGLYTLSVSKVAKVPVPVPPIDEQIEAIDILSNAMIEADLQIIAVHHSLTQAAAQRKNILKFAFSGQLVPQDPNDEPASVLLERIRAERQKQASTATRGRKKGGA